MVSVAYSDSEGGDISLSFQSASGGHFVSGYVDCDAQVRIASIGTESFFRSDSLPTVDLATAPSISWQANFENDFSLAAEVGDKFAFGWRTPNMGGGPEEYFYGWTQIEFGSLIIEESFANNTVNGSISIGQTSSIPEPSSALLVSVCLGALSFRRRRTTL